MFLKAWFFLLILLGSSVASAGYTELSVSGSYRRSNLDENNFTETKSITGSFAYYFMALSAIEFSFTKGLSTVETDPSTVTGGTTETEFQLLGADFVLSYGDRSAPFRPYIKLGVVHVDRKIVISNSFGTDVIRPEDGLAPSLGIGLKLLLSKTFAIKLGLDAWTSPLKQDPIEVNYTGRAGISWFL